MNKTQIYKELSAFSKEIYIDESMKKHTSFKTGGNADVLIKPYSIEEIANITDFCKKNDVKFYIIGNGTNVLVKDGGIRGVVIRISHNMNKYIINDTQITADAGALLITLAQAAYKEGLTGLEFACGIPGTLGGAIRMNAGAFKGEMSDIVASSKYLDANGNIIEINKEQHNFSYRNSIFKDNNGIILEATIDLQHGISSEIQEKMAYNTTKRMETQPLQSPSAGSSFKRPEGYFPGKLIEECGLKGYKLGGAQISEKHANFIINADNATSQDILDLIKYVQIKVYEKSNIMLEPEVQILGCD